MSNYLSTPFQFDQPLVPVPGAQQIRASTLNSFGSIVRKLGGSPQRLLERCGIDPYSIDNPDNCIDCASSAQMLEICGRELSPVFGMELANQQIPSVFGCLALACLAAPDLHTALTCFVDYAPIIHAPDVMFEFSEDGKAIELRWRHRTDHEFITQGTLYAVGLLVKLLRVISRDRYRLSYVTVMPPMSQGQVKYMQTTLGCPFNPGSATNAIGLSMSNRAALHRYSDRTTFFLLEGYLKQLAQSRRQSIVERVESYSRGMLPLGACNLDRCAQSLGLPSRSLQFQLGQHSTHFAGIVSRLRMENAKAFLTQGSFSLREIADALGYSEQTSFGRAFRKWTGMTPAAFQNMARSPSETNGVAC